MQVDNPNKTIINTSVAYLSQIATALSQYEE